MKKPQIYYVILASIIAFIISWQILGPIIGNDLVVQDDFRQSMFWTWRLWDPELFKNDFFAPMYESHTYRVPLLFLVYKLAPLFTPSLIFFSKFLVLILAMLTGLMAFLFFQALLKHYECFTQNIGQIKILGTDVLLIDIWALCFSTILMITTWCTDHLSAAHSRSFVWLGILAYLYLKLINKQVSAGILCLLSIFISPHAFLICFAMEFFDGIIKYRLKFIDFKRKEFLLWLFNGVVVAFTYLVVFKDIKTQGVGTSFTVAEMKALPEFNPGGRHPIFGSSVWDGSWWQNEHWGLGVGYLPISSIIKYAFVASLFYLFFVLVGQNSKKNSKTKNIFYNSFSAIFTSSPATLLYAAISLYTASQLLFPVLYLPSRYLAVPSLLLSVICLTLIVGIWLWQLSHELPKSYAGKVFALALIFTTGYYWNITHTFYHARYVSITPAVNEILSQTPKDSLIAAHPLLPDISTASITSKRKVFIDYERSMAYTHESLAEIRRRNEVAIRMTYAKSKEEFIKLADANHINYFLALYNFYQEPYISNPIYMEPYNALSRELVKLNPGESFFLQRFMAEQRIGYAIIDINKIRNGS